MAGAETLKTVNRIDFPIIFLGCILENEYFCKRKQIKNINQ